MSQTVKGVYVLKFRESSDCSLRVWSMVTSNKAQAFLCEYMGKNVIAIRRIGIKKWGLTVLGVRRYDAILLKGVERRCILGLYWTYSFYNFVDYYAKFSIIPTVDGYFSILLLSQPKLPKGNHHLLNLINLDD